MNLRPGALVVYKQKPALITGVNGDKLELGTPGGSVRVRPKDVTPLHPGPVPQLGSLQPAQGEPREVWELLEGESLPLADVAELAFGRFTPDAALAVWGWLHDGTYFSGTPERVQPRPETEVRATLAARQQREEQAREWASHLAALRRGEVSDPRRLADVEALALGRANASRTLAGLGRAETPEQAHALLLQLGVWDETRNPHPERHGVTREPLRAPTPPLPEEDRLDLTRLPALAIDDEGSADPDDAISLERRPLGWRLWVHVADAGALVTPNSALDEAARERGATLYLPEGTVPMLPPALTDTLALGLADTSPALSIALDLDAAFEPQQVEVYLTRVRVQRLTYAQAQARLHEPLLADLAAFARAARERRARSGAVFLELPEVRVRLEGGEVRLTPLPALESRSLVQEAMMLAGWGAATWANERGLPLPFAAQDPPLDRPQGESLSANWARRRTLSRTRFAPRSGPHAGLGLDAYAQATSPLRRYLDLVVHQQLRAELRGERPLSGSEIAARAAQADLAASSVRAAERASNRHWTLVHLRRHPDRPLQGVVVDRRGPLATVLLPDVALDTSLPHPAALNETLRLGVADVDLPTLTLRVRDGQGE